MEETITVGADEAGRGCVFGMMTIAATANINGWRDDQVTDSKKVASEKRRNQIAERIRASMVWNCAAVSSDSINQEGMSACLNQGYQVVLDAILKRLRQAFPSRRIEIIIDGLEMPFISNRYNSPTTKVIAIEKADAKVFEVGAASLVAKSTRDAWVHSLVKDQPTLAVYDLDQNKGYGTQKHAIALMQHGLTRWHRKQACVTLMNTYREKARAARCPAGI